MEVEGRAMEVEATAASGNSKRLLRSHVEDYCNIIVEGMKVGLAWCLHHCIDPEAGPTKV